ncbi:MAG: ABC transporter substrate-binding protein [Actinobacteria bacterium]|nr:ABC transporter substrate-binding protein [Actinomycetota bacterium]
MKRNLFLLTLAAVLIFSASFLAGCTKKSEGEKTEKIISDKPMKGGTYNHPLYADPVSLDPAHISESEGFRVGVMIFEGLVKYDPKTLEVKPALAESWEVNKDATVFTFKIRKGVKFHNGKELKASDFKKAWERACAKETQSEVAYILAPIKGYDEMQEGKAKELSGVKAIDDYTLEVTLKYPFAEFIQTLGHPVASAYPVEEAEKAVKEKKVWETPIGTGPFKFVSWKHNQEVVIERNTDYWGEEPYLDKVVFRVFEDENTAFMEFKAGNLHDCAIPTGQLKATKEDPNYGPMVKIGPELAIYYYGFNMEKGVFAKDKNLRLAIEYATDRDAIINTVMEGLPIPATGIVPKGIPGYVEGQSPYKYDEAKAKEYWEKSSKPKEITLWYNTSEGHQKIAEAAQAGYKKVGINVKLTNLEWGTFLDKVMKGECDFFRMGWIADYPSMDNFLYPLFHSSEKGNNNMTFYSNPEVDKLLEEARKETNEEKRHELYRQAEKKILEDAPLVPIYFYQFARVVQPDVKNYHISAMGLVPFEQIWLAKK